MIRNICAPRFASLILLATASIAPPVLAWDVVRDDVGKFVEQLVAEYDFERSYVESVLAGGDTQQKILDAMRRPAEKTKAWYEYRAIFITPKRIEAGAAFLAEHTARLQRIAEETGVPAEVMAAIVGVETFYGRRTGSFRVIDALGTLAFDYPPRSRFFRGELEQFFLLAREEDIDINNALGSYAGAMGPPQFIPSSYRAYAVDGDGDGRRDLLGNWDDILASVANYFVAHKWRPGEPVFSAGEALPGEQPQSDNKLKLRDTVASLEQRGIQLNGDLPRDTPAALFDLEGENAREYWVGFHNAYVITRYNRSVMYALAVFQLSEALGDAAAPMVATLEQTP
ncbi:MAG: lytic murein transglycosylase B [Gammaproteobacteria bacterium]|nr:lytic murein transglycosylase B [Gammaproteobacteria bacterium]